MKRDELVPVIPPQDGPYMEGLYGRNGLETTSEASVVMSAARNVWGAGSVDSRVETAELLLGRRIDEQEFDSLPAAFGLHISKPGDFTSLVAVMAQIAEVESRTNIAEIV